MINHHLDIVRWNPDFAEDFKDINQQWIEAMFSMEAPDVEMLNNPQQTIIDQGGQIWFVIHDQFGVVGTCALRKESEACFELTKMGVLSHIRGLKVGETLLKYVLNDLADMQVSTLFLLTNKSCEAAIHLYEKSGFVHDAEIKKQYADHYDRCDVAMCYSHKL